LFISVATVLLVVSLSLAQLTETEPATRILARTIAILAEVDSFIEDHREPLVREAEASEGGTVAVEDFPVLVELTSGEVLAEDQAGLRNLIVRRAAERVYKEGPSAFREEGGGSPSLASREGILERFMDAFRSDRHDTFMIATYASTAALLVLAVFLLLTSQIEHGLIRLGTAVALGALVVVIAAGCSWLALALAGAGSDDYLTSEFFGLLEDIIRVHVRNAIIVLGAAVALGALGFVLSLGMRRTAHSDQVLEP
jgi:hypothetical protein